MKKCLVLAAALLTGCALTPPSRTPATVYDFGLQQSAASSSSAGPSRLSVSLLVAEAAAPVWLDNPAIQYRLAYQDPAQPRIYANSRWAAAPAALLSQRIRSRIAAVTRNGVVNASDGVRADYTVRLELEEFTQVFDSAEQSRAVIRLRASLVGRNARALLAQHSFSAERAASAANAAGAAHALTAASDELADALVDWLTLELAQERKEMAQQN